jgi:hypothetical protein
MPLNALYKKYQERYRERWVKERKLKGRRVGVTFTHAFEERYTMPPNALLNSMWRTENKRGPLFEATWFGG